MNNLIFPSSRKKILFQVTIYKLFKQLVYCDYILNFWQVINNH